VERCFLPTPPGEGGGTGEHLSRAPSAGTPQGVDRPNKHTGCSCEEVQAKKNKRSRSKSRPVFRRHRLYLFVAWLDGRRAEELAAVSGVRKRGTVRYLDRRTWVVRGLPAKFRVAAVPVSDSLACAGT
jgi:hypothetical protein